MQIVQFLRGLFRRTALAIERVFGWLVAGAVFAMVAITVVDVVGRYFLNSPIRGSEELISVALGLTVSAAIPLVTYDREHISVSLLSGRMSDRVNRALRVVLDIVCLLISAFLVYQLCQRGAYLLMTGEETQSLRLPLWPIAFVMAVFWMASTVALALFMPTNKRPSSTLGAID